MNITQLPPLDLRETTRVQPRTVFVRAHVTASSGVFVWRDELTELPHVFDTDGSVFDFTAIVGVDTVKRVTSEDVTRAIDGSYADHCAVHDTAVAASKLTKEEAAEIERLASLLATARVKRHRVRLHDLTTLTEDQANEHVTSANAALSAYLDTLVGSTE